MYIDSVDMAVATRPGILRSNSAMGSSASNKLVFVSYFACMYLAHENIIIVDLSPIILFDTVLQLKEVKLIVLDIIGTNI